MLHKTENIWNKPTPKKPFISVPDTDSAHMKHHLCQECSRLISRDINLHSVLSVQIQIFQIAVSNREIYIEQ